MISEGLHSCGISRNGVRGGRTCTSQMFRLDIRPLVKTGCLSGRPFFTLAWGPTDAPAAQAQFRWSHDHLQVQSRWVANRTWNETNFDLRTTQTRCNFGGERAWWVCPVLGCGRRAAVLYGRGIFCCRRCHDLAYRSQHESDQDRAFRAANRIREQLGWCPGVAFGVGKKPSGLHWSTFHRLLERYERYIAAAVGPWQHKMVLAEARLALLRRDLKRA